MFHRFAQPNYFGAPALPAGPASVTFNGVSYNLINVVSGGVGIPDDSSAFADGAKAVGPNEGTYFVAFGEDAKSINANRGLAALARNTDTLDDWFHRDLALPVRTNLATSGGVSTTLTLPAQTFVGTSPGFPLHLLFSVVNDMDAEILNGEDKVVITSITGAVVGDGFSTGLVTLNLNVPIPNGFSYRVLYSTRSNLATLPAEALLTPTAFSDEASTLIQSVIQMIKGENLFGDKGEPEPLNTLWDDVPYFTLRGLGHNGLDGMYRRRTLLDPVNANNGIAIDAINTAGAGAFVVVNGPGILLESESSDFDDQHDPIQALLWGKDTTSANTGVPRIPFVSSGMIQKAHAGFTHRLLGDGASSATRTRLFLEAAGPDNSVLGTLQSTSTHFFEFTLEGDGSSRYFAGVGGTRVIGGQDILSVRLPAQIEGFDVPGGLEVPFRVIAVKSPTQLVLTSLDGSPISFLIDHTTTTPADVTVGYWFRQSTEISHSWLWSTISRYPAFLTEYNALVGGGMTPTSWGGTNLTVVAQSNPLTPSLPELPTVAVYSREGVSSISLEWGIKQDLDGRLVKSGSLAADGSFEGKDGIFSGAVDVAQSVSVGTILSVPQITTPGVSTPLIVSDGLTIAGPLTGATNISGSGDLTMLGTAADLLNARVRTRHVSYARNSSRFVVINTSDATNDTVICDIPYTLRYNTLYFNVIRLGAGTGIFYLYLHPDTNYEIGDTLNFVVKSQAAGNANYSLNVSVNTDANIRRASSNAVFANLAASASGSAFKYIVGQMTCVARNGINRQWEVLAPPLTTNAYANVTGGDDPAINGGYQVVAPATTSFTFTLT